ncbi:hypothetical protein [Actinoalloteichus hymeniacidonis]|uniref:Uncharacterized protein n=1 Tax=Actinoalloteichus hymeniacidonis TaxID=340345 RepID=A0AAC9HMU0_9PSEU|nr:hypothetical protein [Actinoalloteichus hymeniacidonis]AOS62058.1 hypothetical protein TL08_06165 [Actinoalloteichus hymeniacidonis]MBB5909920.1 hypothetical protein [Actinoalloteichus hymeniacidonis]
MTDRTPGDQHGSNAEPAIPASEPVVEPTANPDEPLRATDPLLIDQVTLPEVGIVCQRHAVFVDEGETLPSAGEQAFSLCGIPLTIGPPPAEMLPGVPAEVVDCADCQAIIWDEPAIEPVGSDFRLFVRRRGTIDVHIVEDSGLSATTMTARCGALFRLGEDLEQLAPGCGAPCNRCLLASLSGPATLPEHLAVSGEF